MLLSYIEDITSRKLRSGEYTWSEIRPYVRNEYYPRFKEYLRDNGMEVPNAMVFKSIRDLHISRRDSWLKRQRKLRSQE